MKKILAILMLAAMVFTLVACTSNDGNKNPVNGVEDITENTQSTTENQEFTEEGGNETIPSTSQDDEKSQALLGYKEELKLAGLMTGKYYLDINNTNVDFYIVKGVVEELLDFLGYNGRYSILPGNVPSELHPVVSASIILQGKEIGIIGKLHPSITKDNVFVFEINLDKLLQNRTSNIKFKEIPKFLGMEKDVAFVVKKNITNKVIVDTIIISHI